jgi:hypothetical protein
MNLKLFLVHPIKTEDICLIAQRIIDAIKKPIQIAEYSI